MRYTLYGNCLGRSNVRVVIGRRFMVNSEIWTTHKVAPVYTRLFHDMMG
jgi:hypothetical protein